jgi:hypothetical protein
MRADPLNDCMPQNANSLAIAKRRAAGAGAAASRPDRQAVTPGDGDEALMARYAAGDVAAF